MWRRKKQLFKNRPLCYIHADKKDYMGNDQLLPAYNVQFGVAEEYIAVADVNQYRSDMDCFVPLMEQFHKLYGFYPKYPVADAGYGSYNNYIYCEKHGMEKYMKFPMFKKETTNKKYMNDPFRPINFKIDENGTLRCPAGKAFQLLYRQNVRGNKYGRQEQIMYFLLFPSSNDVSIVHATIFFCRLSSPRTLSLVHDIIRLTVTFPEGSRQP